MKKQIKSLLTISILGVCILILIPVLSACGNEPEVKVVSTAGDKEEQEATKEQESKETEKEPVEDVVAEDSEEMQPADLEASPENQVFKVGDTVEFDGLALTITKAEFTPPTQYGAPNNGKVLTLHVEAVNNSNGKLYLDNTEFSLYSADGVTMDSYYSYDETAVSGSFNAGKKLVGKLYYDVPEAKEYELIYTPMFNFGEETEIVFKIQVQ